MTIVILIAANAEWKAMKEIALPREIFPSSPYGEWFRGEEINGNKVIYFQTGCGKIASAGATQYVISEWQPSIIVNIGTCGGIEGRVEAGQIILVNETIIYDIIEEEGNSKETHNEYSTKIDVDFLIPYLPEEIMIGKMLSADRDLIRSEVKTLKNNYDARVVDWESGSIAYIAGRNKKRCVILRGVSDLVSEKSYQMYGDLKKFEELSYLTMSDIHPIVLDLLFQLTKPDP